MEAIVLLIKKLVGVGMVGAIGVTGVSVSGEAFNTVKDYLLAAATPTNTDGPTPTVTPTSAPTTNLWGCTPTHTPTS